MSIFKQADLVLSSHALFTGLEDTTFSGSVAIKDKHIIAVGSEEEVKSYIGPNTKVNVYENQLIMPGFQDFHLHLFLGSLSQDSVWLIDAKSEQETAEMVKTFADSRPNDPWVIGFSWYHVFWDEKNCRIVLHLTS